MQSPPSILLVANWDSDVGYAWWLMESYWAAIAEHYAGDYRILLAYPSISRIPEVIEKAPIECLEISFRNTDRASLKQQSQFIRQHQVKLMYFSDAAMVSPAYAYYRLFGVNHIINHDHTPGERSAPAPWKLAIKKLLNRVPGFYADGVLAATDYVRQRHLKVNGIPAQRCFTVQNGLRASEAVEACDLNEMFGIPEDRCVVVTTGRANRYKGIDFAIRVIAKSIKEHDQNKLHYLFCGDGPDLEAFRKEAQALGIADHVSLPGRLSNIPQILKAADCAFHPSSGEVGYSMSILEYMQAGLPVLVPDNPSVCGATRHEVDGLHYRERDEAAAAQALKRLVSDEQMRSEYGSEALRRVNSEFTLARGHQQLLSAIDALIAR